MKNINNEDYFFEHIFPYLDKEKQKRCLSEIRKEIDEIIDDKEDIDKNTKTR